MRANITAAICVLGSSALIAAPAPAAEKCHGERVTISFLDNPNKHTITGTNGRDVILGGPADERIDGNGGDDVICGGPGEDKIGGGPGNDELDGEGDDDTFGAYGAAADPSEDRVDGGPGQDLVTLAQSPGRVVVNLRSGAMRSPDGGRRRVDDIENLSGSPFDDLLIADDTTGEIDGSGGNDTIEAGRLDGNIEASGGAGSDTIAFATAPVGVKLVLDAPVAYLMKPGRLHKIRFEGFEAAIGSEFSDRLAGTKENDALAGGGGNDLLKGLEGNDTLNGGDGSDLIHPGDGLDTVIGGANDPVTSARNHGDMVSYALETYTDPDPTDFDFGFSIDLTTNRFGEPPHAEAPSNADYTVYGNPGYDLLDGIESARGLLKGGDQPFNDLIGTPGPNVLIGGSRSDVIEGGDGDDFLFGLQGFDVLNGDAGNDYLDAHGGGVIHGGTGTDTCSNTNEDSMSECEKRFPDGGDGETDPAPPR